MKRYFEIKDFFSGEKTRIYTIIERGESLSETEKFFVRFKDDPKFKKDVEIIAAWIRKIGSEGALERFLRPENKGKAIPIMTSSLRLYCHRVSDEILILGNGGRKTSQKVKDSPDAFPHFQIINGLAFVLNSREANGKITISKNQLSGELKLFLETNRNE